MKGMDFLQVAVYLLTLLALTPVLGHYMAQVYGGNAPKCCGIFSVCERKIYSFIGIRIQEEMDWKEYALALVVFNSLGFVVVLFLELFQAYLPLNPQHLPNVPFWLSFNTAVSFMTNTNWQAYSGESTLSYLVQMLGLGVQNFLSAATGMAVMVALARAVSRKETRHLGSFWVDLVRSCTHILLPMCVVVAVILIGQGVVQSFDPYPVAQTLEGGAQQIPLGPAASQIAIKQLGTNGGGFFGLNSAHPFENPTPLSNFVQMLSILLLPSACVWTFGLLIRNKRHAFALYGAMFILFFAGLCVSLWAESQTNPVNGLVSNLEGKEVRFGVTNSVLWSVATTAASNGSVNAMHDSFLPLSGLVAMFNLLLGEIVYGGVGAGVYGMVLFAIVTVFLAGLMVGRSPEYLGKKIESREVTLATIAIICPCLLVLLFASLATMLPNGLSSIANKGPHGLSEILYAFASAANNNGSAFGGLNANTNFYNILTGVAMLIGRFVVILPVLAISGSFVQKKTVPPSTGTFPVHGPIFIVLLLSVILIVGALTYAPVLSLGPIVEHYLMTQGRPF
jgi:K+-transporting ATPase ATPase A chain